MNSTYAQCTMITFDLYFENDSSVKCHFHEGKSMSLLVDLENWSLMLNFFTMKNYHCRRSVQFSHSVMSDSLRTHGIRHPRPPCPSPTPGVYSDSCLLSQWCHPAISSSVIPFSSGLQSFPASGSFPMTQFFASSRQVLEFQLQHQSFQRIFRTYFL